MAEPKKEEQEVKRVLLGKMSSNLSMGIVGLPNVGKSSLFNILTKLSVPSENRPFTTIDPNTARVPVPDDRFNWLVQLYKPASKVPAALEVTDIAGLIRGASQGEGLGNAFLSHIHQVDGIFHVIRIFDNEEIIHVEGNIDPVRDLEIINEELSIKDLEVITKMRERTEKELTHKKDKKMLADVEVMKKCEAMLKEKKQIRFGDWKAGEIETLNSFNLLTAKPVVYVINMSEDDFLKKSSKWLGKIKKWVDAHGSEPIVPISCSLETALMKMDDEQRDAYMKERKITGSSINKLITTGYHTLELSHYFTAGSDEVKCWTFRNGTKAPQAAGIIHTDFEKGFICAEVMKFQDLKELGNESAVKTSGKYKQEGKGYTVLDGDIIYFRFNVTKKK